MRRLHSNRNACAVLCNGMALRRVDTTTYGMRVSPDERRGEDVADTRPRSAEHRPRRAPWVHRRHGMRAGAVHGDSARQRPVADPVRRVGVLAEPAPAIELRPGEMAEAVPGMIVHKTGRTTRHTRGRVRAVNVNNYLVDVGVAVARFDGQVVIETDAARQPFSRPGDSGSLIVDEDGRPVALLFAGSASGGAGNVGITGANPISYVAEQLGVTLA